MAATAAPVMAHGQRMVRTGATRYTIARRTIKRNDEKYREKF
jgi:hypothetical protein